MEIFQPEEPTEITNLPAMLEFIQREHRRIAVALAGALPAELVELHSPPVKVKEFLVVAADGTNWNPGAGRGVYVYYSGTWNKLG